MHDWQREDAPVWALDNLALALRMRSRDRLAMQVSALSLARDPANLDAVIWAAVDAVVEGRPGDARALLGGLSAPRRQQVRPYSLPFLKMAEAAIEATAAGDAGVAVPGFREQRRNSANDALLTRTRRRLAWRLVSRHSRIALWPVRMAQLWL
jgi:hypothetical protein